MLAAIIDSSEDAIISKDLFSRVTSWNKAAERLFGYSETEMIGQLIHRLIPEERKGEEYEIISKLKQGVRVEHYETVRVNKNGQELHVSLTISPIRDGTGRIVGASKIARDITRQKQNEERLVVINELGKSISAHLDVNAILQIVTDGATRITNAAFGAFFYNKVDTSGETYMLYSLSGASRESFEKLGMPRNTPLFHATFNGIDVVRSDDITKDPRYGQNAPHHGMPVGHLPVKSYLAVPIVSHTGIVIGGLFLGHPAPGRFTNEHENWVQSIASQAAIALDNARLYQEVNTLSSKKDQFISFASHELKTPLTTIKGYIQIAEASQLPPDRFFPKIHKQIERLEGIISELLDISRIQAGKMDFKIERTGLLDLLKESIESVDTTGRELVNEWPADNIPVAIDRQKMSQVLVNLLTNAIKYSETGSHITVAANVLGEDIEIVVSDEGIGIDEENLGQIFNQYYRTSTGESKAKGMGLGLFIAKEIVEAHSGRIWAESTPGKGSAFHVVFPIEKRLEQ
jgi:PAS domain S-box-containing protein